ncbi:MAG: protein kinase [Mogibacterium sp.]|nr:protein kinase [Mogibacterium sp.]
MKNCYYSKYEPIFGSWRITEELGSGAEGHLYRIRREDALGNVFYSALKAISIPANGEAELEAMMAGGMSRSEAEKYFRDILSNTTQEFELLAKLKGNSNIVSYEDHEIIEKDDGFGWDLLIRMEELTPLIRHSIHSEMNEADIIRLGIDICSGLVLCNKYNIVHRDIKPENIFISPSGSYKLGDFGIARMVEGSQASLSRKGTFSFMAPEIYWGKPYGHAADVYSLGLVMYKYLNDGRMPLMPMYPQPVEYRDAEAAFAARIGGKDIPAPRNGSDALRAVVTKACAYRVEDRYKTAEEMMKALETISRGADVPKPHKRKKGFVIAATIALLCLCAFGTACLMIPRDVTDIEVTGLDENTKIYIGEELVPEYAVKPEWFKDEPITFASGDTDVFTVDNNGVIHAVSPGESILLLVAKEYSEEATVTVIPKVTSIEGIDDEISLTAGDKLTLEPKLKPEEFASEPVTYEVKDKSVATVSGEGVITAVSEGETVVTVSSGGCDFKTEIEVSDPVIYTPTYTQSTKSSGSGTKTKKKSGASKGYFDSSDDEHF